MPSSSTAQAASVRRQVERVATVYRATSSATSVSSWTSASHCAKAAAATAQNTARGARRRHTRGSDRATWRIRGPGGPW